MRGEPLNKSLLSGPDRARSAISAWIEDTTNSVRTHRSDTTIWMVVPKSTPQRAELLIKSRQGPNRSRMKL